MKRPNILTNLAGLTLIELLIAVSLFTIVMVISTSLFLRAIDSQSRSVSVQTLQESLDYAVAYMSAETATAIKDPTSCNGSCASADDFFCSLSGGTQLVFRDADGACVLYEIASDGAVPRLQVTHDPADSGSVSAFLTPATMRLTALSFNVGSANDGVEYIGEVTMALTGQSLTRETYPDTFKLQTTVAVGPTN